MHLLNKKKMRKLALLILPIFVLACDSPRDNNREERDERDTIAESNAANVEVLFRCDTIINSDQHTLSLLLSTYDEAVPVDTLTNCDSIPKSHHAIYQVPEKIRGVAVGEKDVYYSTIKDNQVIVMKSPKGDTMDYEVHLSIPLQPVVKEEEDQ